MNDYNCITVCSRPGESESDFKSRLSIFWTHLLRHHPLLFARVYAETTAFATKGGTLTRQYLVEALGASAIEVLLREMALAFEPIDPEDLYTKYEAKPPEWFWIEH